MLFNAFLCKVFIFAKLHEEISFLSVEAQRQEAYSPVILLHVRGSNITTMKRVGEFCIIMHNYAHFSKVSINLALLRGEWALS